MKTLAMIKERKYLNTFTTLAMLALTQTRVRKSFLNRLDLTESVKISYVSHQNSTKKEKQIIIINKINILSSIISAILSFAVLQKLVHYNCVVFLRGFLQTVLLLQTAVLEARLLQLLQYFKMSVNVNDSEVSLSTYIFNEGVNGNVLRRVPDMKVSDLLEAFDIEPDSLLNLLNATDGFLKVKLKDDGVKQ